MAYSQADNVTMSGGGLYSLATRGAKDVIDIATSRVLNAFRALPARQSGQGFVMADMGCADGGTSLDMIRAVLGEADERWPETAKTIVYADQPGNDFNALVSIIHGRTGFQTWLGEFEHARPLFSGSSFYLQATPDQSLDLIFSATAMHWLSATPCNINNHVHMVGATGEVLDQFAGQASRDWQQILLCRAAELRPGGRMVLVNFCRDEQNYYLGSTGGVNMFDTFDEIWREFTLAGTITDQEYQNMTLPQYYRTVGEFSAPLTDPESPCYQAGLRLDSLETSIVRCPFAAEFVEDGDVQKFADGLIPTVRSWNQSIFAAGLNPERDAAERGAIIEDYYASYHRRVLANPVGHGMDYVHAYMTISRV